MKAATEESLAKKKAYAVWWHAQNKERIAEKRRLLFEADEQARLKHKAERAAYYKKNKEAFAKRSAKFWNKNKDRVSLDRKSKRNSKLNYSKEKEKFERLTLSEQLVLRERASKRSKLWRDKHPDKVCEFNLVRRKREACVSSEDLLLVEKWIRKIKRTKIHRCSYCDKTLTNREIHIDHILPLAAYGKHRTDNLCVSCGPCNLSKGAKIIGISWFPPNYPVDKNLPLC